MAITKVVGAWPQPDNETLEEVDGTIKVKDGGITQDKLANHIIDYSKLTGAIFKFKSGNSISETEIQDAFGVNPNDYNNFGLIVFYIADVPGDSTASITLNETPSHHEYVKIDGDSNSGSRTHTDPGTKDIPYLFNTSSSTGYFSGFAFVVRYEYTSGAYFLLIENNATTDNNYYGSYSKRLIAYFETTKPTFNLTFGGAKYIAFMPIRFV